MRRSFSALYNKLRTERRLIDLGTEGCAGRHYSNGGIGKSDSAVFKLLLDGGHGSSIAEDESAVGPDRSQRKVTIDTGGRVHGNRECHDINSDHIRRQFRGNNFNSPIVDTDSKG